LAALTLLTVTVWLKRTNRPWLVSALPSAFMLAMTLWSLALTVQPWLAVLIKGQAVVNGVALVALILMGLAALVLVEGLKALARPAR
jgi:carbon starvation protein CstA